MGWSSRAKSRPRLGGRLARFLSWWLGELAALVPRPLQPMLAGGDGRLRVGITEVDAGFELFATDETTANDSSQTLIERAAAAAQVDILLPESWVLRKRVSLPLAAEENLGQVLVYEMDRLTPFHADAVYFDYQIAMRDRQARKLQVDLLVAPRARIDGLLAWLSQGSITPMRLSVSAESGTFNLLPQGHLPRQGLTTRRLNTALGAVAVLLLGVWVALPLWQKQQQIEQLEPRLSAARQQSTEVRAMRERVTALSESLAYIIDQKRHSARTLDVLAELTRLLPDDTWLRDLNITSAEVQIQGEGPAAAQLVALLEGSARFDNARFRSPVMQVSGKSLERFRISADLVREERP